MDKLTRRNFVLGLFSTGIVVGLPLPYGMDNPNIVSYDIESERDAVLFLHGVDQHGHKKVERVVLKGNTPCKTNFRYISAIIEPTHKPSVL
jgi:hypothetical protein